ncbi:MAG: SDR family oxidoreductase [Novosphingobium sp.]
MSGSTLEGKKAVVVGGSAPDGIGFAIARRFREEGAEVVIAGVELEQTQQVAPTIGAGAAFLDMLDEKSIEAGIADAKAQMGGLDIVVNAAGVNRARLVAEEDAAGLDFISRLHFVGTVLLFRYGAAAMNDGGAMLTLSSVTAERPGFNLAAYAGSKAAADAVVKVAAQEYGARGIRVNAIAPGLTHTAMTDAYFSNEKTVRAFENEIPIGRMTTVQNVADTAAWVVSDACISTGERIRVSGGMHLRRLPGARDFELA